MRVESSKYDDEIKKHPMAWLHSNIQEVKNPKNMTANKKHPNNSITICNHNQPCINAKFYCIIIYTI